MLSLDEDLLLTTLKIYISLKALKTYFTIRPCQVDNVDFSIYEYYYTYLYVL